MTRDLEHDWYRQSSAAIQRKLPSPHQDPCPDHRLRVRRFWDRALSSKALRPSFRKVLLDCHLATEHDILRCLGWLFFAPSQGLQLPDLRPTHTVRCGGFSWSPRCLVVLKLCGDSPLELGITLNVHAQHTRKESPIRALVFIRTPWFRRCGYRLCCLSM